MNIKTIQAGSLALTLTQGEQRLDELLGFASRENHKRGFLFVSKVLGKHIPVKPSVMRAIYDELAEQCVTASPTYVIGMAETATGLAAGLADSLSKLTPTLDVYYQHTTRHVLPQQTPWFSLSENHSHAVDHILYTPNSTIKQGIDAAHHLILVDDEVTTGRTLLQLAQGVIARLPAIKQLTVVTLASWIDETAQELFTQLPVDVKFVSLIKGRCEFTPDPEFSSKLPDTVDDGLCTEASRDDLGRTGIKMPYCIDPNVLAQYAADQPHDSIVVIGTGEHLYYPFLIAEHLEQQADVLFQSTTRSPILKGGAIGRKTCFSVAEDKIHYIYNLPTSHQSLVLCESDESYLNNALVANQSFDIE